jgi:two-component sensor histidine kinase
MDMNPTLAIEIDYKKRFLCGAFVVMTTVTIAVAGLDYWIGNRIDALIDLVYGVATFLTYRLFFVPGHYARSAIVLFWLSVAMELVYLTVHAVDFNIIFALLIPIIAFIALTKRQLWINLALYYLILITFLAYHYAVDTDNPFLHRTDYLIMYGAAHAFMIGYGIFYALTIDDSIKKLAQANRTKTMLLREVHHRVKNNLNLVASIMGLQIEELNDPAMREMMLQNRRRIESMALLHEVIYAEDRFGKMALRQYVDRLVQYAVQGGAQKGLRIHKAIAPITVPIDALIYLGIMLHEMLTNSIKHARGNRPEITIEFTEHETGYRLRYCDTNRVDLDTLTQGFGYGLIVLAARYFGSEVTVRMDDAKQFCYAIDFKDKEAWRCNPSAP